MKKKFVPLAILAAGAVIVAALALSRGQPETRLPQETAQRVEGIVVQTMTVVPRVTTYGDVTPDRTWTAVAQVSGQVAWQSPKLKNGEFVGPGEELLRIDEREFELAISKARADTDKIRARLVELETDRANLGGQLELLRQAVAYNERELERQQNLYESKAVSASVVEQQRITVLDQQRSLSALQANHDALPSQIAYQQAELASAEAALRQAEINLEHTVFTAPFRGRLDEVAVETTQYVPAGQTLLKLDSIDRAEVTIGISPLRLAMLSGVRIEKVVEAIVEQQTPPPQRARFKVLVDNGNGGVTWDGRFGRIGASVDPATRMIEMVVVVDEPYQRPTRGRPPRPPLSKGTFCTVIMYGRTQPDRLVVPRQAVREGAVYVATADSRLEIRPVTVAYSLDKYAVLESGLSAGEKLIVSDIVPAVSGMLLEVVALEGYYERAAAEIGEGADA